MKKEVEICDDCKDRFATTKCCCCNKDLCRSATCCRKLTLELESHGEEYGGNVARLSKLFFCRECSKGFKNYLKNRDEKYADDDNDFPEDIYLKDFEGLDKIIGDRIQKAVVLERLEKESA